jgi:2OG-Fe(II) oxygenase superfamily
MGATASVASTVTAKPLLKPTIFEKAEAVIQSDPFPYTVVKGALPESARAAIAADFPNYDRSGFFPYQTSECGPSVQRIVDEMQSPAFADALGDRLGVPRLSQYPTIVTIRKLSKETDGRIHNDSKSKIVTALLYLNDTWPNTSDGCFRFLSSPESFDHQVGEEVKPLYGTFTAFRRTETSWHGHLPYKGERRVIQVAWLTSKEELERKMKQGRVTRFLKQIFTRA